MVHELAQGATAARVVATGGVVDGPTVQWEPEAQPSQRNTATASPTMPTMRQVSTLI